MRQEMSEEFPPTIKMHHFVYSLRGGKESGNQQIVLNRCTLMTLLGDWTSTKNIIDKKLHGINNDGWFADNIL